MNQQIDLHNKNNQSQGCALFHLVEYCLDSLNWWAEQYFKYKAYTVPCSQRATRHDITQFIAIHKWRTNQ
jgi:hypothetical protein